jgi:hypothetical protein
MPPPAGRPSSSKPKIPSSSIFLAKTLGPKTAAKTVSSSSAGRASIAELLGATVVPKTDGTGSGPAQQRDKIKAKMRMREKNNGSVFSFATGDGTREVTRTVVKKGWKPSKAIVRPSGSLGELFNAIVSMFYGCL